jgi:hypothetical protein
MVHLVEKRFHGHDSVLAEHFGGVLYLLNEVLIAVGILDKGLVNLLRKANNGINVFLNVLAYPFDDVLLLQLARINQQLERVVDLLLVGTYSVHLQVLLAL